eukprot:scaffold5637_cov350-Prasinococcus_capsulatus_cf.AAC.1
MLSLWGGRDTRSRDPRRADEDSHGLSRPSPGAQRRRHEAGFMARGGRRARRVRAEKIKRRLRRTRKTIICREIGRTSRPHEDSRSLLPGGAPGARSPQRPRKG